MNGFPAKPTLGPPAARAPVEAAQRPMIFTQLCIACHSLGGTGGAVGPALDGVGNKFDAAYFDRWLRDPPAVKPGTKMPKLPLNDAQLAELVPFLSSQKEIAR